MKKRAFSLLLAAVLAFTLALPAAAYDARDLVSPKRTYTTPFADTQGTWCADAVRTCYEVGLLDGKAPGRFAPQEPLTYGQIVTIAARLHHLLHGGDGKLDPPAPGQPWYAPAKAYLETHVDSGTACSDYLLTHLLTLEDIAQDTCDRYDFVWYLAAVVPEEALPAINQIGALPDVEDEDILRFYNAGILTGSDDYGTFRGLSPLNRGQAAAMLARVVSPAQRVKSSLKTFVASQVFLGLAPETPMVTVDGYTVTAETYTYFLLLHLAAAKMENYFSIYDTYPAYFEAYMQDDAFEGDFRAYLLEKHGIQADAPIAWDAPDKGGMTPAQKVRSETLKSVTQLAAIMGRRADYPLTAQQKEELRAYVASSGLYGYSDAMTEELGTMMFTLDNITDAFSLTSDQLDEYLEESGYVYGQYVSIYRGEEGFFETDQQAREAAETARGQMNAHRDDAEYLEYLIWKYSDDHATAPDLIAVDQLSLSSRQTLSRLAAGQVSPVLEEEDRYLVVLKLDPSQDETVARNAAMIPAEAQVAKWAEAAAVTLSPACQALRIAAVDQAYSALAQ